MQYTDLSPLYVNTEVYWNPKASILENLDHELPTPFWERNIFFIEMGLFIVNVYIIITIRLNNFF